MWLYEGKPFTEDMADGWFGFVYRIENLTNQKVYYGQKKFNFVRRVKSKAKGKEKARRKTNIKCSDWLDYYGSNETLKSDLKALGKDNFKREIIYLCERKADMNALELMIQVDNRALFDDNSYNAYIGGRISRSQLSKNLIKRFENGEFSL